MDFDVQEVIADRGYMVEGRVIVRLGNARYALIYRCTMPHLGQGKLTGCEFKYHSVTDRYQYPEGYFPYLYEKLDNGG